MQKQRQPRNIRRASFLEMSIEVGTIESHLYAKGITKGNLQDGWWILLTERPDGLHEVKLSRGKMLVGRLEYTSQP